jgi:type IV pilus assembly protein PilZ
MANSEFDPSKDMDFVRIRRRAYKRIDVRLGLTITSESNVFVGFAGNISEGGLFVATQQQVDVGSIVEFEIGLSDGGEPIQATGEICWQRLSAAAEQGDVPGFGARFLEIGDEDRQRLERFLETREPLFCPE